MKPFDCKQMMNIEIRQAEGQSVSAAERRQLARHLQDCEICRRERMLLSLTAQDPNNRDLPALDDLTRRRLDEAVLLAASFKKSQAADRSTRRRAPFLIATAAAAAAAAVTLVLLVHSDDVATAKTDMAHAKPVQAGPTKSTSFEESAQEEKAPVRETFMRRIVTGTEKTRIALAKDVNLLVGVQTTMTVRSFDDGSYVVELSAGEVLASLTPKPGGHRFAVETRLGRVEVKGTVFAVTSTKAYVEVSVLRGRVVVIQENNIYPVTAENSLRLHDMKPQWMAEVTRKRLTAMAESLALPREHIEPQVSNRQIVETSNTAASVPPREVEKAPSSATLLAEAERLRKSGDWRAVEAAYRALIDGYPNAPESNIAIVALGGVYLEPLARPLDALALFDQYLSKKPMGTLAEEALFGKSRALSRLGRTEEERIVLERFIQRFPKSPRARVAEKRLNEVLKPERIN